jgi:uncharacterized protein (DUF362 family)
MTKEISRRSFMKQSAAIGVTSVVASATYPNLVFGNKPIDVSVVKGDDYLMNTKKAVGILGGMERFVPKNSKVAILANPQRHNPGAFTKPEIVDATIQMCKEAGAKEIACISWLPESNWESTGIKAVIEKEDADLIITDRKDETLFKPVPVPRGKALKEACIMKTVYDFDVFIDIPITKDHAGNKFTGTLKNLMGINSPQNNRTFHRENWKTDINSIKHLDQSIADLNTIIEPDLCIVDATEFIITNGPFGPGELHKPQKVVAGTDRVAIDSYCATLWGLDPRNIIMINKAHEHGLGEFDPGKLNIKEEEA